MSGLTACRLRRGLHVGEGVFDFLHQGEDEIGSGGDIVAGGLLQVDGCADDDVLRLKRRQQQGDVALEKFEPLRGGDRARQTHWTRSRLADHGGAGEQARHGVVELLLRHRPRRLGQDILADLNAAAVDGEASCALDQRGGAGTVVRRALDAHGFRGNDHAEIGAGRCGPFRFFFVDAGVQSLDRLDEFFLGLDVLGANAESAFIERRGAEGQAVFFFQIQAEAIEQGWALWILGQLDEGFLLPHAQRNGVDRGGGERFVAAG